MALSSDCHGATPRITSLKRINSTKVPAQQATIRCTASAIASASSLCLPNKTVRSLPVRHVPVIRRMGLADSDAAGAMPFDTANLAKPGVHV